MSDFSKKDPNADKVAKYPIPGSMWDALPPMSQLALLVTESARFMANMHLSQFGGFQILVVRGKEAEIVLAVGRDEEVSPIVTSFKPRLIV